MGDEIYRAEVDRKCAEAERDKFKDSFYEEQGRRHTAEVALREGLRKLEHGSPLSAIQILRAALPDEGDE